MSLSHLCASFRPCSFHEWKEILLGSNTVYTQMGSPEKWPSNFLSEFHMKQNPHISSSSSSFLKVFPLQKKMKSFRLWSNTGNRYVHLLRGHWRPKELNNNAGHIYCGVGLLIFLTAPTPCFISCGSEITHHWSKNGTWFPSEFKLILGHTTWVLTPPEATSPEKYQVQWRAA